MAALARRYAVYGMGEGSMVDGARSGALDERTCTVECHAISCRTV